ncbi:MAG: 4Fe-4S binding protein [Candidatus Heimdallarchaeota archaeon]
MTEAAKPITNPYIALSDTLDNIPNGFCKVEDGTHLRLLEWIFTPEEAALASLLKLRTERVSKIAKRARMSEDEALKLLKTMRKKGQLRISVKKGETRYGLYPFVVGIYEEQVNRMDAEFAHLFEEYVQKTRGEVLFSSSPPIQRVIPIDRVIKTELEIHPYSIVEEVVSQSKSWAVRDCICRKQQKLIGKGCDYPMSVCLTFSSRENAYTKSEISTPITRDEALDYLKEAEDAGLIHTTMNVAEDHKYVCNCCACCCGILNGLTKYEQPNAFAKSDYVISIDEELCIGCGKCVKRCQFNSLTIVDKVCVVDDRCIGCGVCATVCTQESLKLVPRKNKDKKKPPKNIFIWMLKRSFKRRKNILKVI